MASTVSIEWKGTLNGGPMSVEWHAELRSHTSTGGTLTIDRGNSGEVTLTIRSFYGYSDRGHDRYTRDVNAGPPYPEYDDCRHDVRIRVDEFLRVADVIRGIYPRGALA